MSFAAIRLLRSESFRLAALFASLLMAAMLLLTGVLYVIADSAFNNEIVLNAHENLASIQKGYQSESRGEAIEVVNQLLASPTGPDYLILETASGTRLAGNLPPMPIAFDVRHITIPANAAGYPRHRKAHTALGVGEIIAPGLYAFAAQDLSLLQGTRERALQAFGWILAASFVLAIGGGLLFSRKFLERTDAITRTCNAIMAGRLSDRIPVLETGDELGRLATVVNAMLDRINALMENVRQISDDIAHDLRTPLTRLRNRLELARSEAKTVDDFEAVLDHTIRETDIILSTFSALLRIGQIEASATGKTFARVDLVALARELAEIYGPAAEDRGQTLSVSAQGPAEVLGDRELLSQLFVNLIANAIAHTPEGSRIAITLSRENGAVLAQVIDNGPGIPAAERDKVFRRFYRLEKSRSTAGNGLGLSLAAAIVQLHHASIALSDAGPGLCVTVRIPTAA